MPDQTPPVPRRAAWDPLTFLRNIAGAGTPIPVPQPVPPPAPPAPQAAPAYFAAPQLPPGQLPDERPDDQQNLPAVRAEGAQWRPIQTAPAYYAMAEQVRQLLAVYSPAPMESMQICMPGYGTPSFDEMKAEARRTMIELALPGPLARVELERHLHAFGESQVSMFTDAERTHCILMVSRPQPILYRWEGGPNPALNRPLADMAPEEVENMAIDLPEAFTREMPVRMPYQGFDMGPYDELNDDEDVEGEFEDLGIAGNQENAADGLTSSEVAAARAAAWLPAVLSPGYASERNRLQLRAIMEQFSPVQLEDMQMIAAGVNGPTALRIALRDIQERCTEVPLPPHLAGVPLQGGNPVLKMYADFDADQTLLHSTDGNELIYRWSGGPALSLLAPYRQAREAAIAAAEARAAQAAAAANPEIEPEQDIQPPAAAEEPKPPAPPAPEIKDELDGPGV